MPGIPVVLYTSTTLELRLPAAPRAAASGSCGPAWAALQVDSWACGRTVVLYTSTTLRSQRAGHD
jgi:hypothetical protein